MESDADSMQVIHKEFVDIGKDGLKKFCNGNGVFYDIKEVLE